MEKKGMKDKNRKERNAQKIGEKKNKGGGETKAEPWMKKIEIRNERA